MNKYREKQSASNTCGGSEANSLTEAQCHELELVRVTILTVTRWDSQATKEN